VYDGGKKRRGGGGGVVAEASIAENEVISNCLEA